MEKVYTEESTAKIEEWSRMSDRDKCKLSIPLPPCRSQLMDAVKKDRQFEAYRDAIWVRLASAASKVMMRPDLCRRNIPRPVPLRQSPVS